MKVTMFMEELGSGYPSPKIFIALLYFIKYNTLFPVKTSFYSKNSHVPIHGNPICLFKIPTTGSKTEWADLSTRRNFKLN